jgi:SAM-dependent methyltransferase
MTDEQQPGLPPISPEEWDARYASSEQVWSGQPNGGLVAEVLGLVPGRALDVGCGEGADALWLASQGWNVTALEVSGVALGRAQVAATAAGITVRWVHVGLVEADLPSGAFDLVSVQYPALLRTAGEEAEHALLDLVAPEGTLLVVHHADIDIEHARERGFDPADYVGHEDLAALLGSDWEVLVAERRARHVAGGAGSHHTHDLVLKARRQP